jgi:hypothetical protein
MTIVTTRQEQMAAAHRYESEQRWAQAAEAYGTILALGQINPIAASDLEIVGHLQREVIDRIHESASLTMVPPSEAAKREFDRRGELIAKLMAERKQRMTPPEH